MSVDDLSSSSGNLSRPRRASFSFRLYIHRLRNIRRPEISARKSVLDVVVVIDGMVLEIVAPLFLISQLSRIRRTTRVGP